MTLNLVLERIDIKWKKHRNQGRKNRKKWLENVIQFQENDFNLNSFSFIIY